MGRGGQHYEDVPHLVEAEDTGLEIEYFGDVHDGAKCIHNAARHQPADHRGRQYGQHLSDACDGEPAHRQIDSGIQPARRTDVEDLHDDPDHGQRPDDAQHPPLPKAIEGVDAERRVRPCDEAVDRGVVDLAEDFQHPIPGLHHMIGRAG